MADETKEELTLNQKLRIMQVELKAPKNQYNNFGKYKYRSAEDILEAVKPINEKYGVTLTLSDKPVAVGDRVYIEATAKLSDDNNFINVTAYARESLNKKGMDDSQITGTASSYARKYALNGLYLIDDTKDADTDEYTQRTQKNDFKQASQKQVELIKVNAEKIANARNVSEQEVYKALNVSDVTKLSTQMASKTIRTLNKWIEQASDKNAST